MDNFKESMRLEGHDVASNFDLSLRSNNVKFC
ncbi:hypothetical protein ACTFQF_16340 [Aliivibrio fischeri]